MKTQDLKKGLIGLLVMFVFFYAVFQYTFLKAGAPDNPENSDYSGVPPFMMNQDQLLPNLVLIMDNSAYMGRPAYCKPENATAAALADPNTNQAYVQHDVVGGVKKIHKYSGLFDNNSFYIFTKTPDGANLAGKTRWNSTGNIINTWGSYNWYDTSFTSDSSKPIPIPGNMLNWAVMSKFDVMKAVTVGGKVANLGSGNYAEASGEANIDWVCKAVYKDYAWGNSGYKYTFTFTINAGNPTTKFTYTVQREWVNFAQAPKQTEYAKRTDDKKWFGLGVSTAYAASTPSITQIEYVDAVGTTQINKGPVSATVTIKGNQFGQSPDNKNNIGHVYFGGGVEASVTSWSVNQIVVTVPSGAVTGNAYIVRADGVASNSVAFTILQLPNITWMSPTQTFNGDWNWPYVYISGYNFGAAPKFTFNTVQYPAVLTWSSGSYTEYRVDITGIAAGTYTVRVQSADGWSNAYTLTVINAATAVPILDWIWPEATSIIDPSWPYLYVDGYFFGGSPVIKINGITYPSTWQWSSGQYSEYRVNLTGLALGTHSITVTNANGTSNSKTLIVYDGTKPVIRSIWGDIGSAKATQGASLSINTLSITPFGDTWDTQWNAVLGEWVTTQTSNPFPIVKIGTNAVTVTSASTSRSGTGPFWGWMNASVPLTLAAGNYNVTYSVDGGATFSDPFPIQVVAANTWSGSGDVSVFLTYNPWGVIQELFMVNYDTADPQWKSADTVTIPAFLNYGSMYSQNKGFYCMEAARPLSASQFANNMRHINMTSDVKFQETLDMAIKYFKADTSTLSVLGCTDPITTANWCKKNFILFVGSGNYKNATYTTDNQIDTAIQNLVTSPHISDIRSDISGVQNITFYSVSVSAADTLRDRLKVLSRYGGFTDKNTSSTFDSGEEYTLQKKDISNNAIPDTYFEPIGDVGLGDQIKNAVSEIMKRATSGTAVSVLATSAEGEGALFQAFFRPMQFEGDHTVHWLGYLQGLFIDPYGNIREDSAAEPGKGDKKLNLKTDMIITLTTDKETGDTVANRYLDSDGDGKADTLVDTVPLYLISTLWEAGKSLAETDTVDKVIGSTTNGRALFTTTSGGESGRTNFIPGNAGTLESLLRASSNQEAQDIINFVRGEHVVGYRNRLVNLDGTNKVWKLADIIYSTPTVVSVPSENYDLIYGDQTYFNFYTKTTSNFKGTGKSRRAVVYVGSNDGVLHAFSTGTFHQGDDPSTAGVTESGYFTDDYSDMGKELWGFIPRAFLPHLKWQVDSGYNIGKHVYGIDLKVKIFDANCFTPDTVHEGGWGTVLIGGMRLGGGAIDAAGKRYKPAYFALDITDPTDPKIMWEFTHSELGLTLSYPAIVQRGGKWYALIGSGPNYETAYKDSNGYFAISNRSAKLFVVDIKNFSQSDPNTNPTNSASFRAIDTTVANAFIGNPVTLDSDLDFSTDVAYFNIVAGTTIDNQSGYLYRLNTTDNDILNWTFQNVFTSSRPLLNPPAISVRNQDMWIYLSSGRYLHSNDKTLTGNLTTQNRLYGLKDPCYNGNFISGCTTVLTETNLANVTAVDVFTTGTVSGTINVGGTNKTAANFDSLKNIVQAANGWMYKLTAESDSLKKVRERGVSKPSLVGDIVLFSTFIPESGACSGGGEGFLYALYSLTGTAYNKPIIGTDTSDKTKILKRMTLGTGTPSSISIHMGREKGGRAYIQQSTGAIQNIEFQTAAKAKSTFILWREKW